MNIQKILTDIKNTGLTDLEIGVLIGTTQPTIHRIRMGRQKRSLFSLEIYQLGKKLCPDIYDKTLSDIEIKSNTDFEHG